MAKTNKAILRELRAELSTLNESIILLQSIHAGRLKRRKEQAARSKA